MQPWCRAIGHDRSQNDTTAEFVGEPPLLSGSNYHIVSGRKDSLSSYGKAEGKRHSCLVSPMQETIQRASTFSMRPTFMKQGSQSKVV